ncbi:MAG: sugar phosphate nucleotidyltransferase, partial [Planctomycetota bacterium]
VVLVLCGDAPLIPEALLRAVLDRQAASGADCVAVAAEMDDPSGYGRMITAADGSLQAIVEHKDATPAQRQVRLVNSGLYAFDATALFERLQRIRNDNAQGEYYLPDVIRLLVDDGRRVELVVTGDSAAVFGVNTPADLTAAEDLYARRQADD